MRKGDPKGRSLAAEEVAKEVIETVRSGKKPNLQKIQMSHGYSKSSARAMKATKTKSYNETMDPFLKSLIKIRDKAIKLMDKKVQWAQYSDLRGTVDSFTKLIELLSGRPTDRPETALPEEDRARLDEILGVKK